MPIETTNFISDLRQEYPLDGDLIKEGDDHIRNIKKVLKQTFRNFAGYITISNDKLNKLDALVDVDGGTFTVKGAFAATGNAAGSTANNWDLKGVGINNLGGTTPPNNTNPKLNFNAASVADIMKYAQQAAWPVDSVYVTTNGTNPGEASRLGFGTWQPFSPGRVLVGVGNDGAGFSCGLSSVGGAATVTLSTPQIPPHAHAVSLSGNTNYIGDHVHRFLGDDGVGGYNHKVQGWDYDARSHGGEGGIFETSAAGGHSHSVTVSGGTGNAGSGQAHENMPPYRGVYYWIRTA